MIQVTDKTDELIDTDKVESPVRAVARALLYIRLRSSRGKRMETWRISCVSACMLAITSVSWGQTYNLSEEPKTGESFRLNMETNLIGVMKIKKDDRKSQMQLSAKNEHTFVEKVLATQKGVIRKSARFYDKSLCIALVGNDKTERSLRDDRRLIVAQRIADNLTCYSPAGPLTRRRTGNCRRTLR